MIPPLAIEDASIADLQAALEARRVTSLQLVEAYLARIEAYDRAGPRLNAVRAVNPDARAIARRRDARRFKPGTVKGPLYGIPILLKDNIATADRMPTTAGSLALDGAIAVRDATVTRKLRRAGAILLGKANLTEFANFATVGMPAGYSALGGQVLNPYVMTVDENGIPLIAPGGSSAGSGVAVAAALAAATIGTETAGSLLSPASANGVVTIKPTVGLISRAGIIPIAASQDTAGPMTRTVRDAALLLGPMTGVDPLDPATRASRGRSLRDYTPFLDPDGLKGARIGVPRDPADVPNDIYYRPLPPAQAAVMEQVIATLKAAGAELVEATIPTAARIGGAGTVIDVPVTNRFSPLAGKVSPTSTVFLFEFKTGLADYLRDYAPDQPVRTLADAIAFYRRAGEPALRFGQDLMIAAEATDGLAAPAYREARRRDLELARDGLEAYMAGHRLDAILFPANAGAGIAAKAGWPSVLVPAGMVEPAAGGRVTQAYPMGATFTGRAFSEPLLIRLAYAFEQASRTRRPPASTPALSSGG